MSSAKTFGAALLGGTVIAVLHQAFGIANPQAILLGLCTFVGFRLLVAG